MGRPMKILHAVFGQQLYGSERYCIELATLQAGRGHEVAILIHDGGSPCAGAFRQAIAAARLAGNGPGRLRLLVIPRWTPAALHRPLAFAFLKTFAPDVVHTHLNTAARRVGRAAQSLGIPHVATLHIRYDDREHGRCDGLICAATWQRDTIPQGFRGLATTVWAWLPVEVRGALARLLPDEVDALRREWSADARTIVFGSIGRVVAEKGMDVLVDAFRGAFPDANQRVVLVVVGDGLQLEQLGRAAAGDPRILLLGHRSEIAKFYRAFDVYVSAARFEPYGLTLIEAMAASCPLVVTRTEGPREFLSDKRVLWAEAGDVPSLSRSLLAATERGRERVSYDLTPFLPDRSAAAIEQFYWQVVNRKTLASAGSAR